jgi:hypothetical protein
MPKDENNKFINRIVYRKRLLNLILKRFSQKDWLHRRDDIKFKDQLSHNDCEALWAKINFTLQTLN